MNIHIVAGGPVELIPSLITYSEESIVWVGVDRGLFHILKQGIIPSVGIGDFDSVTKEELEWMKSKCNELDISPAEKDQTDIELALEWALAKMPKKISVFGATGGRLDHALASIQLLIRGLQQGVVIEMIDCQNILRIVSPGTYSIHQNPEYPYVSFLPFSSKVRGIILKGFKYPLTDCNLEWGSTLCISNELIEETGTFSFIDGIVIMVKSKDFRKE
jgi:thiamine pyrophosphokinase